MKKLYSILALCLCCVLLFAACNGGGTQSPTAAPTSQTTTAAGTETKAPEDTDVSGSITDGEFQVSAPGEFPIVMGDTPATLRVFSSQHPNVIDMDANYATKWLEEKTNVHVDWMMVSAADSGTKLNLMLAANDKNEMPDVFMIGFNRGVAEAYGEQGVLMDLTDLIDQYGINHKANWDKNPGLEDKYTAYDGGKYFLARYYETVHVTHYQKFWMNMQWLENVGKTVPTTTEEFKDVLTAFRDNDPNQNGKKDDIPFIHYGNMSDGTNTGFGGFIMNAFVYSPTNVNKLYVEDGTIKVSYVQDGWREGLRYYKDLYDEKLLDNECFSMTTEQAKALAVSEDGNRIGSKAGYIMEIFNFDDPEVNNFETIAPLEGPTGLKQSPKDIYNPDPFITLTSYCKYPVIAMRWADAQFYDSSADVANGDYTWLNLWYGEQGVGWDVADAGATGFSGEPAAYKWLFNWGEDTTTHWFETFLINMPKEWKPLIQTELGNYPQEKIIYEATVNNYLPYEVDMVLPNLSITEAESIEAAELRTNLNSYYVEMAAKFVRGEADLDADWDKYVSEINGIGLTRLLEIYQAAYDR